MTIKKCLVGHAKPSAKCGNCGSKSCPGCGKRGKGKGKGC